jgi:hypothetical protein
VEALANLRQAVDIDSKTRAAARPGIKDPFAQSVCS